MNDFIKRKFLCEPKENFFLRKIAEIKKQGKGAGYFIQIGTPENGKEKNAETENGMFWAVGNHLLDSFLARARGLASPLPAPTIIKMLQLPHQSHLE